MTDVTPGAPAAVAPIKPPFTWANAVTKVRMAEDAWNSRDPQRVSLAYTEDSVWRNRAEFLHGRAAIQEVRRSARDRALPHSPRTLGDGGSAGSRCVSPTSGTATRETGSAPTAPRTGSSMPVG